MKYDCYMTIEVWDGKGKAQIFILFVRVTV